MYQNSNWNNNGYYYTNTTNDHEFSMTTNHISYQFFPQNIPPNQYFPNSTYDRSYTFNTVSYPPPTYPPPPYKPPENPIQRQEEHDGYNTLTPTESLNSVKSVAEIKKKKRKKADGKVLGMKESNCKKHAAHSSVDERQRCEENRLRNRLASRRSRKKKIDTIERQKNEIEKLKLLVTSNDELLAQKDVTINQILKHQQILNDRVRFLENHLLHKQKMCETVPNNQVDRATIFENQPTVQNAPPPIAIQQFVEAEKYIGEILENMHKMGMDDNDKQNIQHIQNTLQISTPILNHAVQYILKPPEPIHENLLQEDVKAKSKMEHFSKNDDDDNKEEEYEFEPRPENLDILEDNSILNDDETMNTPFTVSVKETVINSQRMRVTIQSVKSTTSPTQYQLLTNK